MCIEAKCATGRGAKADAKEVQEVASLKNKKIKALRTIDIKPNSKGSAKSKKGPKAPASSQKNARRVVMTGMAEPDITQVSSVPV